ncbi:MAG: ribonuclease Y [Chloroflexi bacterium]|nr:ribonuclease Y [Chloroflexota bacterium]
MIIGLVIGLVIGAVVFGGIVYYRLSSRQTAARGDAAAAEAEAARKLADAETRQKELLLEAKEEAIRLKTQAESELTERRAEITRQERRLAQREENLDRKSDAFEKRDRALAEREAELEVAKAQVENLRQERVREVERVAELTRAQARDILMADIEREVREDANRRLRLVEAEMKEVADRRSRSILATAIQRVTTDVTGETTVTVVPIPSDDMKGRIIGREGRNIRALEHLTGCDLIIDDTPDAVTLSGFDPVRREVARIALTRLIQDGRIHPTRIEEMVEKARREVEQTLREAGEAAALEAGCPGLHPEVLKIFGRLKYRTSYGQNQLKHAVETSQLGAIIAHEIGANVEVARRACLLHDLGKAVDHEVEGTHALIGADIARRYGIPEAIVHGIEAHHEEVEPSTVEALIVIMADSISGGRPGARRESLERYIQRLEALEGIANGFPGVEKSFAIQAGREVRIIVRPEEIDDLGSMRLARDISRKIEESMEYPGQIKVTVVRETRAVDYAK